MLSERRLGIGGEQVSKDPQDTSGSSPIYDMIGVGLIALFGHKAYKAGMLKDIAEPLLNTAAKIASEGGGQASITMHTVKEWSKLKYLTPEQLSVSRTQKYSAPKYSIFRERDTSVAYDILHDFRNSFNNGRFDMFNIRRIMDATKDDIDLLAKMSKENNKKVEILKKDYTNTDLYWRLKDMNTAIKINEHYGDSASDILIRSKAMEELVNTMTLTKEQAEQELLESGYRKLVLGDILERKGHELVLKDGSPINLDSKSNQDYMSLVESINRTFSEPRNRYNGKAVLKEDWKNIIVDSNIRINEKGNIIDYRMAVDALNDFKHSLATDFKLPVVGFNPFKMIGWDKKGRKKPFMGMISPDQLMPSLTGYAGREMTIGKWLGENFGSEYENTGVAIINGKAYMADTHTGDAPNLVELGSGFNLYDISNANVFSNLSPVVNAERQIANLDLGSPVNIAWDEYKTYLESIGKSPTKFQEYKYKIGQALDLGHQEFRFSREAEFVDFDTISGFDEFTNNMISKVTNRKLFQTTGFEYDTYEDMFEHMRKYDYKSVFGIGYEPYDTPLGNTIKPRMYFATKEGYKFSNVIDAINNKDHEKFKESVERFFKQYSPFTGRNVENDTMSDFFTERTTIPWMIMNNLSEGIGSVSSVLGLSVENKSSTWDLMTNLLIRRALPVYALTQVPGIINGLSEPFLGGEDENGNRDNITKFLMRNVAKPFDITAHQAMDLTGATNIFKFFGEMVPGSDQINELPVIYQMGLGQTTEERREYIENGYDPIRKGRYWGSGNTPLTGGKIMYYRPNLYRRIEADVKFSDSKYGSRQEYYNNTWFPNPLSPLAPLNYFILDKNHYDNKHYQDRPYPISSPVGENIPIIGPLFSATAGQILAPPRRMHMEYWRNGLQPIPGDEEPPVLLTEGMMNTKPFFNPSDIKVYQQIQQSASDAYNNMMGALSSSSYRAKQVISRTITQNSGIRFQTSNISLPYISKYQDNPLEVYSTPSGNLSIVDIPDNLNLYNINQDLQKWSLNQVPDVNRRVNVIDEFQGPDIPHGNDNPAIDKAFNYSSIGNQYNVMSDVAGLKGFVLQSFITGQANVGARKVEDSGYAYSFNKEFWDMNAGGLGANLSEITRRFVPKRDNNVEYVNPIRNTMPSWIPGSDYFLDLKHGDPYAKIENGEERLPGEGYERLHNINGLMDFKIGSSFIGYSKADIVKHMLKQDDKYTSSFQEETLDTGTEVHNFIEKNWKETGFAFDTEGEINDKRNGIYGKYDAMIYDLSSPTGMAIVDIKTTSAKKLKELRKTGQPPEQNRRQLNYYLWATGNTNSNGYLYYVDKENINNSYMMKVSYDEEALKDTLKNVYEARNEIRQAVNKGIVGRGELYDPIDQFRILADVAPYSQEYSDVSARLSREINNASGEKKEKLQKEASEIRDRVSKQKEPLRVYPYKFKTSNLKSEVVTIDKIIDNNTFTTREYGTKHAIKFAGINVSESNSDIYKPHEIKYTDKNGRERTHIIGKTMNDAARSKIRRYMRPGSQVTISYDMDEHNKYSSDSTKSIRAVVRSKGRNINRILLNSGLATEKENDDSPAGVQVRYSQGEIAFGSAMETLTHKVVTNIPFVGDKLMQVRSPYEQYRRREVYGKDFQSWEHPIRDMIIPSIQTNIANNAFDGIGGIMMGGFIGSLFGATRFGKIVGATLGATIPAVGKLWFAAGSTKERDWVPGRRKKQEQLNEYVDILKYVKNMGLYEKYKEKAMVEDNFDVDRFIESKESMGVYNKLREKELDNYKRQVKLDFRNKDQYNFKYGEPKYVSPKMSRKETISAINKEISELQGNRSVTKIPENAMIAIDFKQQADKTMYAYEPGDSIVNIMSALPKKDRQYYKHFVDAPEEEKNKILKIAPSYLRRALQSSWGMDVDHKPTLNEYFQYHGLPDASWIGWDESTNIDDVKVKLIGKNNLDPGEFDVWPADKQQADSVNIPIPAIEAKNSPLAVQAKLSNILGRAGYHDVQMRFVSTSSGNNTKLYINRDIRNDVSEQIDNLDI